MKVLLPTEFIEEIIDSGTEPSTQTSPYHKMERSVSNIERHLNTQKRTFALAHRPWGRCRSLPIIHHGPDLRYWNQGSHPNRSDVL